MEHYLARYGSWVTVIQGAVFVLCVLAFRRGIVGEVIAFLRRRAPPGSAARPAHAPGE
jgi:branched-chain amino acid transport system permease protein